MDDRKSLLALIMVQEEEGNKHFDVNVLRGVGGGISDHHLAIAKIRFLKGWTGRVLNMEEKCEIKVRELSKVMCKNEYEDKLKQRWKRVRGEVVGGARRGIEKV